MSRRNLAKNKNTKQIKRERDPIPWRYCLLTLLCGLILVGGFFFAARQHFSSMDYGIKNSRLRKQKDELRDAQRQLLIDKEIALSPGEIKKAAKKLGFKEMTAANIETFYPASDKQEKPKAEKVSDTKTAKPIVKTDEKKTEKDAKTEKKPADSKDKKPVRELKSAK